MSTDHRHTLKRLAANRGLILLYHSVANQLPGELANTVHNISPATLSRHIEQLSDYFRFVSLRELLLSDHCKGLACITFDDGYKNVLSEALPVLEAHDVPAVLFVNSITFSGQWNWRDKVRYLIAHRNIDAFADQYPFKYKSGRFYRYSKHPDNNSGDIDAALSRFLADRKIDVYDGQFPYLRATDAVINHPLISFGNHSHQHYVLSSLPEQQQFSQIQLTRQHFDELGIVPEINCFSAPFGGNNDVNKSTLNCLKRLGYKSVLMSRQRLQESAAVRLGIRHYERFMPRSDNIINEIVSLTYN